MSDYQRGYRDACAIIAKQLRSAAADLRERAKDTRSPEYEQQYRAAALVLDAYTKAVKKLGENAPEDK